MRYRSRTSPKFLLIWIIAMFLVEDKLLSQGWIVELDSILTVAADSEIFNGQIILSANNTVLFKGAYGKYQNKEIRLDTKLPIASIDKTLVASALIKLEQEGKILFDDLISDHLPDIPFNNITIRHLLNQTSGIPNFLSTAIEHGDTSQMMDTDDILNLVSTVKPKGGPPGEAFHYNNSNYLLCRKLIESISKTSYSDFMKLKVFEPLDMVSAQVSHKEIPKEINADNFYQAGGEIYSTAYDLHKFASTYLSNELVSSENRRLAFSRPLLIDGTHSNYGFGWYIRENDASKSVGHWGGGEFVKSYLELYLSENRSLIILSVDCTLYMDKIYEMIRNIWDGLSYEVPEKFKRHTIASSILQSYVGSYLLPQMGLLHVSTKNGRLYLRPDPVPGKEELVPLSDSTFIFANQDLRWQFYKSDDDVIGFGFENKIESMGPKQENR